MATDMIGDAGISLVSNALWSAWDLPILDLEDPSLNEKFKKDMSPLLDNLTTSPPSGDPMLEAVRETYQLKLNIYRGVISYFNGDDEYPTKFVEFLKELLSEGVTRYPLDVRLARSNEGKEVANKKYKNKNWVGAMYTYAIAWGLLLPYYTDAFPSSNPMRKELGTLECALFSNISGMAKVGIDHPSTPASQKSALIRIGISAAQICITSRDFVSVGIMEKSCRRARELSAKQKKNDPKKLDADIIRFFKDQEALLKDTPKDKLFKHVSVEEQAFPAIIASDP